MTVTKIANLSDGSGGIISPYQGILRNAIINGDMRVAQRGTSFAAIASAAFSVDRWGYYKNGTMVHTITQSSDIPTNHPELQYSLKLDCTTADSSIASTDYCFLQHVIEGYNFAPLAGRQCTLSFWAKGTKTGIYSMALRSGGSDRSYVTEFVVTTDWVLYEIPITIDVSSGTWDYTNGAGIAIDFVLAAGSDEFPAGGNDAWVAENKTSSANQVNACDSTDNNFYLTGVQLHLGSVALPFDPRPYAEELSLCQRYYQHYAYGANLSIGFGISVWSADIFYGMFTLPVIMRIAPSLSHSSATTAYTIYIAGDSLNPTSATALDAYGPEFVRFVFTKASHGFTIGASGWVQIAGSQYMALSAEL